MKHQTCLVTLHKSDFSSLAFFLQLVISCRNYDAERRRAFLRLRTSSPTFFLQRRRRDARNLLRLLLSKRQDNYFLFVGKRQQKFWLRLHLPGSRTRVLLAAKKLRSFFGLLALLLASSGKKKFCCHSCALAIFRAKRPLRNVFWVKVLRSTNATQPVYILSRLGITRRSTRAIVSGTIFFSGNKM